MRALTCRETEKMVMPYIDGELNEDELEAFLAHVAGCPDCREELEIYFTVSVGLRQLDEGTGVFDITGALGQSLENAWARVRAVRLRKVIRYAVNTLEITCVLVMLLMQLRIWAQTGLL